MSVNKKQKTTQSTIVRVIAVTIKRSVVPSLAASSLNLVQKPHSHDTESVNVILIESWDKKNSCALLLVDLNSDFLTCNLEITNLYNKKCTL